MAEVFQRGMTRTHRPRRSWDEGLGGMREAEAREAKAQKDSDKREKAERGRAERGESKPAPAEKRSFKERVTGFFRGAARIAGGFVTGGPTGAAIAAGRVAYGAYQNRKARQAAGVTNQSRTAPSARGAAGPRGGSGNRGQGSARDREGGGRERQMVYRSPVMQRPTPVAAPVAEPVVQTVQEVAPTYIAYQTPDESAYVSPTYQEPVYMQPSYVYSYGNRAWDDDELSGVPSIVIRRKRRAYPRAGRSWDDAELEGLGKSLKKLGKKLKKAVKPKNLLKTAAVAAVAYGGYKLATGGKLTGLGTGLANIGKSLVKAAPKIGGAVMQVAPQLATSYIAYKTATTPEPAAPEDYEGELVMPREFIQDPQGYAPQGYTTEAYAPEAYAQRTRQAGVSGLPSWAIPAAIGAGVLLLVTSRK